MALSVHRNRCTEGLGKFWIATTRVAPVTHSDRPSRVIMLYETTVNFVWKYSEEIFPHGASALYARSNTPPSEILMGPRRRAFYKVYLEGWPNFGSPPQPEPLRNTGLSPCSKAAGGGAPRHRCLVTQLWWGPATRMCPQPVTLSIPPVQKKQKSKPRAGFITPTSPPLEHLTNTPTSHTHRSFTRADMPSSRMGTTVWSRYARIGSDCTLRRSCKLSVAFCSADSTSATATDGAPCGGTRLASDAGADKRRSI